MGSVPVARETIVRKQRSDTRLRGIKISLFQFGEQGGAILLGSRATHNGSAMECHRLTLANRHRSIPVRM
jgi:hypothetical protein